MQEEYGGEEGLLEEVAGDSGKISKTNVNNRIKVIKNDVDCGEELQVLKAYLKLIEAEAKVNKEIAEATKELNNQVLKKYSQLSEDDIKSLVVDDKWFPTLRQAINS